MSDHEIINSFDKRLSLCKPCWWLSPEVWWSNPLGNLWQIGLWENFNRKTPYLMGKSMVSCNFSPKPIHWEIYGSGWNTTGGDPQVTGWWWLEHGWMTWLSRNSWEWKIIPTDELAQHNFFGGVGINHQPVIVNLIFPALRVGILA